MITKGYFLVYHCGKYDAESVLVFSEDRFELKDLENEYNEKISTLRKRWYDTEHMRSIYFEFFNYYFKGVKDNHPNREQFDKFLKDFPIPEELEELVFEDYGIDENDNQYWYLDEADIKNLHSFYSVKELQGLP